MDEWQLLRLRADDEDDLADLLEEILRPLEIPSTDTEDEPPEPDPDVEDKIAALMVSDGWLRLEAAHAAVTDPAPEPTPTSLRASALAVAMHGRAITASAAPAPVEATRERRDRVVEIFTRSRGTRRA